MVRHSTREAAKKLGIDHSTLALYVANGKVPAPETVRHGTRVIHIWTEAEIEAVRRLLPKIANGRKTRYQKLRKEQTETRARASQPQHAKTGRAGGPKPALRKTKRTK